MGAGGSLVTLLSLVMGNGTLLLSSRFQGNDDLYPTVLP
jgi:hypothetical protein